MVHRTAARFGTRTTKHTMYTRMLLAKRTFESDYSKQIPPTGQEPQHGSESSYCRRVRMPLCLSQKAGHRRASYWENKEWDERQHLSESGQYQSGEQYGPLIGGVG